MPRDDPFSVSGDLHGLMGGAPPEIRPVGDISAWYQKLCTSSSGVLYEDTYLQVTIIHMLCTCFLRTLASPYMGIGELPLLRLYAV